MSCLWGAAATAQPAANALPTQGQVVAGQSTISQSGNQMTITQSSQRSAINWGSYNIGSAATVSYNQPNAQSISLNRVVGNDPSQIFGSLRANGQVWLINPNGILFGAGARVDVAGLVASTQNISDRAFMENTNGRFVFDQAGRANAAVVNQGEITVREAGIAALVAPGVANSGTISASLGRVGLASANTFTLDLYGDRLINIAVNDRVMGNAVDAQGNPVRAGVENTGRIMADGGRVEISANVARGVVDNVIRMGGVVQARSATVARNGDIILDGGDGAVEVTGQLDASGRGAGQRGGQVRVRGERITLAPTVTVDVSGDAGGGAILIGGGLRGQGSEPHAQTVSVAAGARLSADAINTGRGGTVVVWSDGVTMFDGIASARGGAASGDGGLVETSGHTLTVGTAASVNTAAPNGASGLWLLDPVGEFQISNTCAINCITPATLVANLNSSDVTITGASASDPMRVVNDVNAFGNPNPHNLTLVSGDFHLDASIILSANGGNITINNSGGFFRSNNAGLYVYGSGSTITLHQNFGNSIQEAINALASYDDAYVIVGPGQYNENIVIDRSVNLQGARANLDATNLTTIDPNTQSVIHAGYADQPGILIQSDWVTINGFTITASFQAGIRVGSNGGENTISNTRILNNYIVGNGAGIVMQATPCDCSWYPNFFRNTIIDANRIEANNVITTFGNEQSVGPASNSYNYDSAGNHGIVVAGHTENTLISRNYILNNNGNGIWIASTSNDYSIDHQYMAIVANRIVNPGEAGIQIGGEHFYADRNWFSERYGEGYGGEGGAVRGLLIVQNTIQNAFQCSVANACTAIDFWGEGTTNRPYQSNREIGLRGAINFEDIFVRPLTIGDALEVTNGFGGFGGLGGLLAFGGGQALSLIGAGIPISDVVAALNANYEWNSWAGYWYSRPSIYIGNNLVSGRGYGVAIQSSVDLGDTVVYINNNHLENNDKGGLLYNLTDYYAYRSGWFDDYGYGSGYGSGSGSGSGYYRYCYNEGCESGRVIAAGNWWGARAHQGFLENGSVDPNSIGNLDTGPANLGNLGPTFTREVFDQTRFRADIQGSGALEGYSGEGVVVSAWRTDGNNQVARLNELLINGQNRFGAGSTYPFPITLAVGGELVGYTPTNFVRVGDWWNYQSAAPVGAEAQSFVPVIYRGPGAWDPAGRITRGVSVIREPLPLLANLIGTSISGSPDNGTVDVLPGYYYNEGSRFVSDYDWNGIVLIDKNNLTVQASVFGTLTPTTPAGLITGTAGAFAYNPDDYDGTLAGRAFPINDPNFPTRNGSFASNATQYEAVVFGGFAVVPNVARGLIGALANSGIVSGSIGFGGEGSTGQALQAFVDNSTTNNFTLRGMTVVGGFYVNQLGGYFEPFSNNGPNFGPFGYSGEYGFYDLPRVGVLLASGQNHVIANNRILSNCDDSCGQPESVRTNGIYYGGEGSIGVWIAPGDALVAGFATMLASEFGNSEVTPPTVPATGSNTQILQNDIVGWNTAGVMVGAPLVQPGQIDSYFQVTPATGVQILRNAIMDTCQYYCSGLEPKDVSTQDLFGGGGAAIVLYEGTSARIQNNWIRNNEIGVVNFSNAPVVINENSFESVNGNEAINNFANPLTGINNWFGQSAIFGQTQNVIGFTDTNPAPDRFDHNPLLPGWQIGVSESTPFVDPTFGRIPADGPFNFLANPFLANQPLGGGGGPSLQEIAPAAGGQGQNADQCAAVPGEQIANNLLGTFNLLNPAVYQQVIRCQAVSAQ